MNQADRRAVRAVGRAAPALGRAVDLIVHALSRRGRLIFVGAGTSGRLGVLEAAECPPTFDTPPSLVQAVIAGGKRTVFRSSEGAEDDGPEGARQIRRRVRPGDMVVGIAASGVTPFVRAAAAGGAQARGGDRAGHLQPAGAGQRRARGDRPRGRPRGAHRLDASQGRHRHQARAQHAHHRVVRAPRQGLRQPHGGPAPALGQAHAPARCGWCPARPRAAARGRAPARRPPAPAPRSPSPWPAWASTPPKRAAA